MVTLANLFNSLAKSAVRSGQTLYLYVYIYSNVGLLDCVTYAMHTYLYLKSLLFAVVCVFVCVDFNLEAYTMFFVHMYLVLL